MHRLRVLLLAGWVLPRSAFEVPRLTGPVGDAAGMLSASAERQVAGALQKLHRQPGAAQIAVAARAAGLEVIYQGIRLTPEQIAATARDEDPDVIGLSLLSGSHLEIIPALLSLLRSEGVDAPVVVGGIIPEEDRPVLLDAGVAAVYTPKDFELGRIMADIVDLGSRARQHA